MSVSNEAAKNCDVFMVIGTSAQVYPAAYLPNVAFNANIPIIEINLEETPLTSSLNTIHLKGKASEIMKLLMEHLD
jgi:NAD-dependent deacetylase